MAGVSLPRRLPVPGLVTLGAAGLLLAGCTSTVEGSATPSPTTGSAATATPGDTDAAGLAAGLLPQEAFGAGAQVIPVSEADIRAGSAAVADLSGATVTPEACAQAVQQSQPSVDDLDDFAAQTATTGSAVVAQLLTVGTPGDPVADLTASVATCPQATITSPDIGTATLAFAVLDVPELGDGSAGLSYTTTATGPDGSAITVPVLIGVAQDGDRLLTLLSTSLGGTPDPVAFGDLLQEAFEHQADALD